MGLVLADEPRDANLPEKMLFRLAAKDERGSEKRGERGNDGAPGYGLADVEDHGALQQKDGAEQDGEPDKSGAGGDGAHRRTLYQIRREFVSNG